MWCSYWAKLIHSRQEMWFMNPVCLRIPDRWIYFASQIMKPWIWIFWRNTNQFSKFLNMWRSYWAKLLRSRQEIHESSVYEFYIAEFIFLHGLKKTHENEFLKESSHVTSIFKVSKNMNIPSIRSQWRIRQWWSIFRTHVLQILQWCDRGGFGDTHFLQIDTTSGIVWK